MKLKRISIYTICLLLLTMVGCNMGPEAQDPGALNPYGVLGDRNQQVVDEYRLNEEEQLMGRGQMEAPMQPFGTISNANTDIPSEKYPHTKAIQIQQAKYKFVVEGGVNVQHGQHGTAQKPGQAATPKQAETPVQQPQAPVEQPQAATPKPAPQQEAPVEQPQAPVEQPEAATPQPVQQEEKQQAPTRAAEGISEAAAKVIELTNAERRKNGLPDYQADAQLSNVATVKSNDMQQNNYFSHTSPTHGSPFDMIRDHGVSYSSAGENIAQGQRTPEQVVQSWMNSEGHRKNILSAQFTHIGVGYNEQGHYWTQMFISK